MIRSISMNFSLMVVQLRFPLEHLTALGTFKCLLTLMLPGVFAKSIATCEGLPTLAASIGTVLDTVTLGLMANHKALLQESFVADTAGKSA